MNFRSSRISRRSRRRERGDVFFWTGGVCLLTSLQRLIKIIILIRDLDYMGGGEGERKERARIFAKMDGMLRSLRYQ